MKKNNKEYRSAELIETKGDMCVEGYALRFERETTLYTDPDTGIAYREILDKNCLNGVDLSDIVLRYNHNDNFVCLARTRNKSLELTVDEKGLYFRARIIDTQAGRDIYMLVKNGMLDGCSFGFRVKEDRYDVSTHTRRILSLDRLFEISICDFPCYPDTSVTVSARDYFTAQQELENKARYEEQKKRLILLTMC